MSTDNHDNGHSEMLQRVFGGKPDQEFLERDDSHFARNQINPEIQRERAKTSGGNDEKFFQELQLTEPWQEYEIYKYLANMPKCVEVMKKERGDNGDVKGEVKPLENTNVVVIHHLDDKAFGAMSVLREWGGTDMTAILVGYNPSVFKTYFPDIESIPPEKFRACIIGGDDVAGASVAAAKNYRMLREYNQFPDGEDLPNDALDKAFATGNNGVRLTYLQAMQCLAVFNFLRTLQRTRKAGKKLLIFEDGGYLHPIINSACLDGFSVAQLRAQYFVPEDKLTDADLPDMFEDALKGYFVGSTEWTRNGYDRSMSVQEKYGKLAYPLFSMACSQLKTRVEGDSIALACLDAISEVSYSLGLTVMYRHVMVLGARGNIGRFFCDHVANILEKPTEQLLCCDLKIDWPPASSDEVPEWAISPNTRIENCLYEASSWKGFPREYLREVDIVFGLTGGPTVDQPTVNGEDLASWLAEGNKREILFVSGSTKQEEYSQMLHWLDQVMSDFNAGIELKVGDSKLLSVTSKRMEDKLATAAVLSTVPDFKGTVQRFFGTQFTFEIEADQPGDQPNVKTVYLLNDTMPVNFMFYGTPTEIIDCSLAQLVDITAKLSLRAPKLETAEVFATGYKRVATEDVFRAEALYKDYNVPLASGTPLTSD